MGNSFKDIRVMESLLTPTVWGFKSDVELKNLPTKDGIINLFKDNKVTEE